MASELTDTELFRLRESGSAREIPNVYRLLDEHSAQRQRIATLEAAVKQLEQRVHEREKEIDRLAYGRANVDF